MQLKTQVPIQGSKEDIWAVITNIENAANNIQGIEKVEVLEKPERGMVGLKWRETRTLFGKTATEVMWVTDAVENEFYRTRAESHGAIYVSELSISEENGQNFLTMSFKGEAQTFVAKILSSIMGFMVKGATKKALEQDLQDIKAAVENRQTV